MSKKTFSEKLNEIVSGVSGKTKGGKMKPTFSRKMFADVLTAMVNDSDYELETVQLKDGKPAFTKTKPVEDFRTKLITPILEKAEMDKADIEKFVDSYEFNSKQLDPMYDVFTSAMYEYMKAGKSFRMPTRKDFKASISIRNVEPSIYENAARGIKVQREAYESLVKKSSCPDWKKTLIE